MGEGKAEEMNNHNSPNGCESGLRICGSSDRLFRLYRYRRIRGTILKLAIRWEGGEFFSATLRRILRHYHGVEVGAYSYGQCLKPGSFPWGVKVGRWASIAAGVKIFLRNHPMERLSTHPFFYNKHLGFVKKDTIETGTLEIGHDAWIGERAIITPGCRRIGIGAVLGAGSVLTKDLPDFAIAAGVPARVIRYRFPESVQDRILESRWWEHDLEDCLPYMEDMIRPVEREDGTLHPLLESSSIARPGAAQIRFGNPVPPSD